MQQVSRRKCRRGRIFGHELGKNEEGAPYNFTLHKSPFTYPALTGCILRGGLYKCMLFVHTDALSSPSGLPTGMKENATMRNYEKPLPAKELAELPDEAIDHSDIPEPNEAFSGELSASDAGNKEMVEVTSG